ncbi:cytochrome b561 and DOMON domain-containing protein At3g25290-like [Typha angustifolia]|uniref:cytochrome b561 and DOMON domain-containing protein At3g25290-like n=1 Tax=Typha angustifolia TaxID=59011 RepID=UPI003C2C311E
MALMGFRLLFLFLLFSPAVHAAAAGAGGCAAETFSNRVFAACNDLPHLSSSLHWTYDRAASSISLAFVAPPADPAGWVAWAINPSGEGMKGAQALIAFKQPSGAMGVKTYNISAVEYGPIEESAIAFETTNRAAEYANGKIRMFATVKLGKGMEVVNQVWQVGASVTGGVPDKHAFGVDNLAAKGRLDLVKGVSASDGDGGSMLRKRNVHGVLNAVSWGILLPIGAIFARYLKTFKSADPAWFYLHVACQLIGYCLGVAGWATGLNLGSKSKGITYTTHRDIGIALFSIATVQIFALFLRPNKDHKYRFYWNIYHHLVGYTVIILGIVNIFKGMNILHVDQKWKTAYIIVICILGGIALLLEAITWIIVCRRKSEEKPYNTSTNGSTLPFSA